MCAAPIYAYYHRPGRLQSAWKEAIDCFARVESAANCIRGCIAAEVQQNAIARESAVRIIWCSDQIVQESPKGVIVHGKLHGELQEHDSADCWAGNLHWACMQ